MEKVEFDKSGRIRRLLSLSKAITESNIEKAVSRYNSVKGNIPTYADSTGYDVEIHNQMYPPKAVYGLALGEVLGITVESRHFTGGVGSECFKTLERLGYKIVPKLRPSSTNKLKLYERYSRAELNDIFDPESNYVAGAGRWGSSGIVPNAPQQDDFAFLVTLEDEDKYADYLTEDGAFFWKSQTRQDLSDNWIKKFIAHDSSRNVIYLFMRVNNKERYCFFGLLEFKSVDYKTNKPVHFCWELMSWPLPIVIKKEFSSYIHPALDPEYKEVLPELISIRETEAPSCEPFSDNLSASKGGTRGDIDFEQQDKINRRLGLSGELAILSYEQRELIINGRADLADQVEHVAIFDPSAGYDIKSFGLDGEEKLIEVKTTRGPKTTPFFISRNEVEKSKRFEHKYWLYRVYEFCETEGGDTQFYKIKGSVEQSFHMQGAVFRARPMK